MKKRSLTLLMTAALGLSSVPQASAPATVAPAAPVSPASGLQSPADPRLATAKVSLEIGTYSGPLSSLLAAIARSAGYDVIFDTNVDALSGVGTGPTAPLSTAIPSATTPATPGSGAASTAGPSLPTTGPGGKPVVYNFKNTPFNQVWPLLMDIYGLTYETTILGSTPVLRVGVKPIQQIIRLPATLDATKVSDQLRRAFGSVVRSAATPAAPSTGTAGTAAATPAEDVVLDSATLKIVPEPSSNSVIVRGTNTEVLQVQALAASIVSAQPSGLAPSTPDASVQKIYTVKGSQASAVSVLTAQYPALKVTPVGSGGPLVISGPQSQVTAALSLLGTVDVPPTTPTASTQRIYNVVGQQADIVALLSAQYPDLKVTPVGQTRQLVLAGLPAQIDAAVSLLGTVDKSVPVQTGPVVVQRVFPLTNASADEVKTVLEGTLAREVASTGLVGNATPIIQPDGTTVIQPPASATSSTAAAGSAATGSGTGTAAGASGGVAGNGSAGSTQATIISDKRTNTLIVRGTQIQVNQIAELIPSLDVKVPQVNVQVRIQEIGENASRSLGIDWKAGFGNFVVNIASGALNAIFDPTQALVGFNIGATLNTLEQQNLTKRVYDGSITMQSGQRSLGGSTETQSASSGAAAHIQSGGRLEVNIPSSAANVPAIQKQIDYGVTLDFYNPQVAPDGTISLRVRGVVNQPKTAITGSTLPNILDFSNSEAQTTITFKAGETVLLSGLLGTNQTTTNTGIPYLTSIPVIGSLFGKQQTTTDRTQLLVVITGNVLQ